MLYPGYAVPPFYDSLLGKLIVWDEDARAALARLDRALGELNVEGLATTKPLHQALARRCRCAGRRASIPRWLEHGWHRMRNLRSDDPAPHSTARSA